MKVRIISDLHIDINEKYPIEYNDDTFTIVAGDICGELLTKMCWINDNIQNGLFVAGNHLCYNDMKKSIQHLKFTLSDVYSLNNDVSFLENTHKIIADKVFIGCTLYTDYNYPCPPWYLNQRDNMYEAKKGLNDFKWGWYYEDSKLVKLQPKHYLTEFNKSIKFIKETVEKFKDKQCILITHHAPSSKSIQQQYIRDKCNASYVNELEEFILDNPNITHWIHGHLHCQCDYKIGNTRIICNARGYLKYDHTNFNKNFTIEI